MDNYALCPCGSGKKVKFCCHTIIGEMEKVERLQENNQPRMALQILEKLMAANASNPWVVTRMAVSYLNDNRPADARQVLLAFLRAKPDHPLANALHAMAVLHHEGFPVGKKAVHRAFRFSIGAEPTLCAIMAGALADYHEEQEHYMAARQHYTMVLKLGTDEERQRALGDLIDLDGDAGIHFALRGGQIVPTYDGTAANREVTAKALRLASVGCWEEAATQLTEAAKAEPSAELWHLVALFRAWDGENVSAGAAFHEAARLYTDREAAIECETIAQLLDRDNLDDQQALAIEGRGVDSVARVLSKLDDTPQLDRFRVPTGSPALWGATALYLVVDAPVDLKDDWKNKTLDDLPNVLARVFVYPEAGEGDEKVSARLIISARDQAALEASKTLMHGTLTGLPSVDLGPVPAMHHIHPDDRYQLPELRYPSGIRSAKFQELFRDHNRVYLQRWLDHPLLALGKQSPRAASQDPAKAIAVAAAINCLESFWSQRGLCLDAVALRKELNVPEPSRVEVTNNTQIANLSHLQLQRVDLAPLSDEQFESVFQRLVMSQHPALSILALEEALNNRPGLFKVVEEDRAQATRRLVETLRKAQRSAEAIVWLDRSLAEVKPGENRIMMEASWKMLKLPNVSAVGDEDGVQALVKELWGYYSEKLPQLREILIGLLRAEGLEIPNTAAEIVTASGGNIAGAGLWTPGQETAPAATGGSLWLPGQD